MKNIILFFMLAIIMFTVACKKEKPLEKLADLTPDYILPQGKSPADGRIVDLYNNYGAYFLYDFTNADFWWYYEFKSTDSKLTFFYTKSNPTYAGNMLDFMNEAFFKFYPKEFIQQKIKLYKVMLVDSLKFRTNTTQDWNTVAENRYCRVVSFAGGNTQFVLGRTAERFSEYNAATKRLYKNQLHMFIWQTLASSFNNEIPAAFTALSDYTKVASSSVASEDYFMRRGFYASLMTSISSLTPANDFTSFLNTMITNTPDALTANWNQYPLLKKKYDVVLNYFINKYGVNLSDIISYSFN